MERSMTFGTRNAVALNDSASLWLCLPASWVRSVGLKKRDKIVVDLDSEGRLVIYPSGGEDDV